MHIAAFDLWQILGRFHVVIIHFPIALLIAAAFAEFFALLRRKTAPSPTAGFCLLLGSLAALASAVTGWVHANYESFDATTLFFHRWLGITTAALSIVVIVLYALAKRTQIQNQKSKIKNPYRPSLFALALLVGITGHLGGTLTHGPNFLFASESPAPTTAPAATAPATQPTTIPATQSFTMPAKDPAFAPIEPILSQNCYFCHGLVRQRGGFRADSLASLLKGGESGPAIIPGDADKSLLIRRISGPLDDKHPQMPFKRPPLNADQIQQLKTFINSLPPSSKQP